MEREKLERSKIEWVTKNRFRDEGVARKNRRERRERVRECVCERKEGCVCVCVCATVNLRKGTTSTRRN